MIVLGQLFLRVVFYVLGLQLLEIFVQGQTFLVEKVTGFKYLHTGHPFPGTSVIGLPFPVTHVPGHKCLGHLFLLLM